MLIHEVLKMRAEKHEKWLRARKRYIHCKDTEKENRTLCGRDSRRLTFPALNPKDYKVDEGDNCATCRFLFKRLVDLYGSRALQWP